MQGKKAIVVEVPVPQLKSYQKIQVRLVRELEKKFSGKHVVFKARVSGSLRVQRIYTRARTRTHTASIFPQKVLESEQLAVVSCKQRPYMVYKQFNSQTCFSASVLCCRSMLSFL